MKNTWIKTISALAIAAAIPFAAHADDDNHRGHGQRDAEIVKAFGLISAEQAREVALKEFPGVVTELELDDRDYGKGWKWEVEVVNADGKEVEVDLDAKTGKILKVDKDWF